MLLGLVLLLPFKRHRGTSGAPDSFYILPVLQKRRLHVLLPQAGHQDGLSLPLVVHLDHLYLLELLCLVLLICPFLRLGYLLGLLEHVVLLPRHACIIVEVTTSRLLVSEVEGLIHVFIIHVHHGDIATNRIRFRGYLPVV